MKNKKWLETQSRKRSANRQKMPLNYYRSGPADANASPFVNKQKKTSKTRKFVVRGLDLVAIILFILGLAYSLIVQPHPKIIVNDTTYHSALEYTAAASAQLSKVTNRNKVSLNDQSVINALRKQYPEISSAAIELPLFSQTPTIRIKVAKPNFFLTSNGINYIIDAQGVATATSKSLPSVKGLVDIIDQSGYLATVGQQILSTGSVTFINQVLAQAAHSNVPVKSLVLPTRAEEIDLNTSDRAYYVKFFIGGDAMLQTGQFLAARHNFDQTGKQPAEYLDVRVPGKIFYK